MPLPFTKVEAELLPSGQRVLDGDVEQFAFSRIARLKGTAGSVLSLAPAFTLVGNLLASPAPVRNWDVQTLAGQGLSLQTSFAAGNFPEVVLREVVLNSTATTGHTYTYPLARQVGQLLIVAVATAALVTITTPPGWTVEATQAGTESRLSIYSRIIDGSEPSTETLPLSGSSAAIVRSWCISLVDGDVEVTSGLNDSAAGTSLDLAAVTPTWSAAEATNNLYIAILGLADNVTVSGFPAGYGTTGQDAIVSATANIDCALAYAERATLGSTENPGAYTYAASRSTGHIIAIKPKLAARIDWDGLTVNKAAVLVGTRRILNLIQGTGATLTTADNPGTGAVDVTIAIAGGGGGTQGWDDTLAIDAHSGANNAFVDTGQYLTFGTTTPTQVTGNIRAAGSLLIHPDTGFEVHAHDVIYIHGPDTVTIESTGGSPVHLLSSVTVEMESTAGPVELNASTFVDVTNGFMRFQEQAASTPSMAAGKGLFWVRSDTPNIPMFTDDANTDFKLLMSGALYADMQDIATARILGRVTAGIGDTEVLTGTQATTLLDVFTTTLKGLVPLSGGGTTNFLRADGTFAVPPGTGAGTGLQFVTFGAEATLSNERVTTASTSITINTAVASQIAFERAALTGDVTASANANATAFRSFGAKSVLANATNAGAVPSDLAGSAAFQHLRVNSGNTGLEWSVLTTGDFPANSVPVTALATIATDTLLANITAGTATPTAVGFATIDSASIVWDATTHTFQLGAASGGDITRAQASVTYTINSNAVTYAKMQDVTTTSRFIGRITAGAGDPEELTGTQATTLLDVFTSALKGLAPASGGGTTNFLRADGTWAAPPGTGAGTGLQFVTFGAEATLSNERVTTASTSITINTGVAAQIAFERAALTGDVTAAANSNATTIGNDVVTYAKIQNVSATNRFLGRITALAGDPEELTGTQATTLLDVFTSALKGLVPLSGGGTTNFLRADGTWAAPPGTGAGTGLQFVTFGAEASLSNERVTTASTSITINTGVAAQIAFERAALTGEVTAGANSNATTVTASITKTWTGVHVHNGASHTIDVAGNLTLQALGTYSMVHNGGDGIRIDSDDATGASIIMEAAAAAPTVIGAGDGMFWLLGSGANNAVPMYREGADNDFPLIGKPRNLCYWHEDFEFTSGNLSSGISFHGSGTWYYDNYGSAGGSIAAIAGEADHPGIAKLTTHTVNGNGCAIYRGAPGSTGIRWVRGDQIREWNVIVRFGAITTFGFFMGFSSDGDLADNTAAVALTGATDFLGFNFDTAGVFTDTTVHCCSREASGVALNTDSNITPTAGTWHRYTIRQTVLGTVEYLIDGAVVATHASQIPDTETMTCGITIFTRTAGARDADVDYIDFMSQTINR